MKQFDAVIDGIRKAEANIENDPAQADAAVVAAVITTSDTDLHISSASVNDLLNAVHAFASVAYKNSGNDPRILAALIRAVAADGTEAERVGVH